MPIVLARRTAISSNSVGSIRRFSNPSTNTVSVRQSVTSKTAAAARARKSSSTAKHFCSRASTMVSCSPAPSLSGNLASSSLLLAAGLNCFTWMRPSTVVVTELWQADSNQVKTIALPPCFSSKASYHVEIRRLYLMDSHSSSRVAYAHRPFGKIKLDLCSCSPAKPGTFSFAAPLFPCSSAAPRRVRK